MNKIFIIIFLSLFWSTSSFGKTQPYEVGDIVQNNLEFNSGKTLIPLPDNEKYVVGVTKKTTSKGAPTTMYDLMLYHTNEKNVLIKAVRVTITASTSTWWKTPKGCKSERPFFQGSYVKGKTFNCWFLGHGSTALSSKDITSRSFWGQVRKYQRESRIIMPDIVVNEYHQYASTNHKNRYHVVNIHHNPIVHGMEPSTGKDFETADYNPTKIMRFPKKEKFMKDLIKSSAIYHRAFEDAIGVKDRQRTNTSDFIEVKSNSKKAFNDEDRKKTKSVVDQLKELNNLKKSGVLSNEEFEKAKNKILK